VSAAFLGVTDARIGAESRVIRGAGTDSPGTSELAFIALKNLQNSRICHARM
jgi:hypothetical protein